MAPYCLSTPVCNGHLFVGFKWANVEAEVQKNSVDKGCKKVECFRFCRCHLGGIIMLDLEAEVILLLTIFSIEVVCLVSMQFPLLFVSAFEEPSVAISGFPTEVVLVLVLVSTNISCRWVHQTQSESRY
jgi:hypothetical protein